MNNLNTVRQKFDNKVNCRQLIGSNVRMNIIYHNTCWPSAGRKYREHSTHCIGSGNLQESQIKYPE